MNISDRIKPIVRESIEVFEKVAAAAKKRLGKRPTRGDSIAGPNWGITDQGTDPGEILRQIDSAISWAAEHLTREPAIVRVAVKVLKVVDEDGVAIAGEAGKHLVYYFSRVAPPTGVGLDTNKIKLASDRSPIGRLAETNIGTGEVAGDERTLDIGGKKKTFEILEFAEYRPEKIEDEEWDSKGEFFEFLTDSDDCERRYFDSFGEFGWGIPPAEESPLAPGAGDQPDLVAEQLSEEQKAEQKRANIGRRVIERMSLRDQPVLDQQQGEVFRLPLNSRLLILGAPGTGKTTTLIRRLGQKLDVLTLPRDEMKIVSDISPDGGNGHAQNWIMFAPTEPLKLYVKEAFNREKIPAPDERIRTWDDYRWHLAREVFEILSTSGRRSYRMDEESQTLTGKAETDAIAWFKDFDQWQQAAFWEEMRIAAKDLGESHVQKAASLGAAILKIVESAGEVSHEHALMQLVGMSDEARKLIAGMKLATDEKIRRALNRQVNRNREFLDEFAGFLKTLGETADDLEDQGIEDEDNDEPAQSRFGRTAAANEYMRAVRMQAGARARGRNIAESSRVGRIIDWLGDRTPAEQELLEVGKSIKLQYALRRVANPARLYIDHMPQRYRRFRQIRQTEKCWYRAEKFRRTDIHPLEVDVILLATLRASNALVGNAGQVPAGSPTQALLDRMQYLHQTQVLVDEASDFSPVQLAAMAALVHPRARSFFACGDFKQRLTSWGMRTEADMTWAVPGINIRPFRVAYRQSEKLHEFACKIAELSGDDAADVYLPAKRSAQDQEYRPVLARQTTGEDSAAWLAKRIQEIEKLLGKLPSIAVLVNSESGVVPIADLLRKKLSEQNIRVTACREGRVPKQDGAVFVIDVKHIKGLEFEAVFFVGVDKLAETQPDLFDKYLYVGATRAATYFGMTCEGNELPPKIAGLQSSFQKKWEE